MHPKRVHTRKRQDSSANSQYFTLPHLVRLDSDWTTRNPRNPIGFRADSDQIPRIPSKFLGKSEQSDRTLGNEKFLAL